MLEASYKVCVNIFLMAPPGTSDVGARGLHLQCLPSSGSAVALSEPACCGSFMSKTCKNQRRDALPLCLGQDVVRVTETPSESQATAAAVPAGVAHIFPTLSCARVFQS